MRPGLIPYIHSLRVHLRLDTRAEAALAEEVSAHLEDQVQDLVAEGMSLEEATRRATESFGEPRAFAAKMYAAYNRGTWVDAALAAMPHLMGALLFAAHAWLDLRLLILTFLTATVMSVVGWTRGRPVWWYPWLGYALLPVLATALLALSLFGQSIFFYTSQPHANLHAVAWAGLVLYLVLALAVFSYLLLRISRRDWVYASLMVLHLPVLVISLLLLERWSLQRFVAADDSAALMFLFLALATAAFIRMGHRFLKIGVVLVITPVFFLLATQATRGTQSPTVLFASLISLLLLLTPAVLAVGSGPRNKEIPVRSYDTADE